MKLHLVLLGNDPQRVYPALTFALAAAAMDDKDALEAGVKITACAPSKGMLERLGLTRDVLDEGVADDVLSESLKRYVVTLAPATSLSEIACWADLIKWVSLGLVEPLPFEEAVAPAEPAAGTRSEHS